jgi:uncharacterized membrane protein YdfJ with MMPL/SSD domain
MNDPRAKVRTVVRAAVVFVLGSAVTVLAGLGSITSFATYMDVHGVTTAMRFAAVGAIAVVVIPAGIGVAVKRLDRIEAKKHRARLAALRYGAHSTSPRGQR